VTYQEAADYLRISLATIDRMVRAVEMSSVLIRGRPCPRLMHREDDDVTEALQNLFEDEGINIVLNPRVKRVSGKAGQSVRIVIEQRGVKKTLEGSHLLVAAGRFPNIGIGLELASVELSEHFRRGRKSSPRCSAPETRQKARSGSRRITPFAVAADHKSDCDSSASGRISGTPKLSRFE
jgi:excisionase family DNA binding protein